MSAFLVSKKHIDVLVAACGRLPDITRPEWAKKMMRNPDYLGRILWRENMASMAYRYPRDEKIDETALADYRFDPRAADGLSIIVLIKAIHCYAYQACEHAAWETSDAKAYCDTVVRGLVCELPGYDAAPWGIE